MRAGSWPAVFAALVGGIILMEGCDRRIGDYRPLSSMVNRSGFAVDRRRALELEGQEIRIWGYVDSLNVYSNPVAEHVPAGWHRVHASHDGAEVLRFDLVTSPSGRAGSGIHVYLPNNEGARMLMKSLAADRAAGTSTRVFVRGNVFTFDAPTNLSRHIGLYIVVKSSKDVLLEHPLAESTP